MSNYLTPGIYVEEVSSGTRSIQGVGTTTAAFVGRAPLADARLTQYQAVHHSRSHPQKGSPESQPAPQGNPECPQDLAVRL